MLLLCASGQTDDPAWPCWRSYDKETKHVVHILLQGDEIKRWVINVFIWFQCFLKNSLITMIVLFSSDFDMVYSPLHNKNSWFILVAKQALSSNQQNGCLNTCFSSCILLKFWFKRIFLWQNKDRSLAHNFECDVTKHFFLLSLVPWFKNHSVYILFSSNML